MLLEEHSLILTTLFAATHKTSKYSLALFLIPIGIFMVNKNIG